MFRLRKSAATDSAIPLFRNRYADEWVGLLVLGSVILFAAAIIEAGVLKQWLTPSARIYFVLPQNGLAGLAVGNDIEVMGVRAGEIRQLDLNQEGRLYAVGTIEPQFKPFIRTDSKAVIRRRFVVTGASYIDISRGRGQPLDWSYAVLRAVTEPNPADMITKTVAQLQATLVPTMKNVQDITAQINQILAELRAGKGTAGALLTSRETVDRANQVLADLNKAALGLQPLEAKLNQIFTRTDVSLKATLPDIHQTAHNAAVSTSQLPTLLTEAEATTESLRKLTQQIRSLWFLGGSGSKGSAGRLPASAVQP
ncbi:MlaD family protein [Oecophyllibacter saccharovorans]|uniref:MlaD family protein n=1 Tax=Oecophyllibacter saccharovorans TaxID=2558360 RepID=UPI0011739362|nr:MlaD family protein [Oecophyllibacter saccharovorans]TPW34736.1 MCE family protein [Oecophyllibacter saccharovorans]